MKSAILISSETPLISNLNMIENIALIKEVHENMSLFQAQALAKEYLDKMSLSTISQKRSDSCKNIEIFYVMAIRAMMTQAKSVIIKLPTTLLEDLQDMPKIIENLLKIKEEKEIYIFDFFANKIHYKESQCSMIK